MPDIGSFGDEDNMQFDTIEAELAYHKDKYQQVADMLEETRNELGKRSHPSPCLSPVADGTQTNFSSHPASWRRSSRRS
jgi:hypothetical protein